MRISVINLTHGLLSDSEIITAIRAVNRQVNEDFKPYWNTGATLRLEGSSGDEPDVDNPQDLQGEAIIYIWDKSDVPNALGYHEANFRGIPYGFVFVDIATEVGENWTVTFSHEVLELLGDRQANTLVRGPHPRDGRRKVYHWHEMCDAVQDDTYEIDGVEVSNFVLPLYFTEAAEPGSRNDFLGTKHRLPNSRYTRSLKSFGINPGGYIGFYDPVKKEHCTEYGPDVIDDEVVDNDESRRAEHRRNRKNKARMARRGNRYVDMGSEVEQTPERIASNKKERRTINGRKISIHCATHALDIKDNIPSLKKETSQGRGYFAHDIYSESKDVDKGLKHSGFEEIAALEISPVSALGKESDSQVELSIDCDKDEAVMALVEVDGIIFWHEASSKAGGAAVFSMKLQTADNRVRDRRGFLLKSVKTVVRFIKHKIVDKVGDYIKNHLTKYLTDFIEKKGFKKSKPARLLQIKLLDNPKNKTIGAIDYKHEPELNSGEKYLVLIHGIFSDTKGAFGELLLNRWNDNLLTHIHGNYTKIVSFDHWTVARDTLENARDLLKRLPDDCEIDIVCHSRGAGVTRCLLEHPDTEPELKKRKIQVGKVIFVAGACQGSPLANPNRIGQLVNVFSALSSIANTFFPLQLATGLLKAVQYGVKNFPGIESMSPESKIFKELNQPLNPLNCEYIYTRSNYEPSGALLNMFDNLGLDTFIFHGKPNDGVVPFEGAGTFDQHVRDSIPVTAGPQYGLNKDHKEHVFHTAFFEQREVRELLIAKLGRTWNIENNPE